VTEPFTGTNVALFTPRCNTVILFVPVGGAPVNVNVVPEIEYADVGI